MTTSLQRSEKEDQVSNLWSNSLPTIRWKLDENRSTRSWDNWSPRNH